MHPEFLQEESRNGYTVSPLMKAVWATQIELFQELYRVCQENGLKCWFDSGSLLGAVRHKGFIPWDDDIDVVMMRDDYEKLKSIASKEFKTPYFLQFANSDIHYFRWHAQLRKTNTAGILTQDIGQEFNQGIFIDIFVMDGYNPAFVDSIKDYCNTARRRLQTRYYSKLDIRRPKHTLHFLKSVLYFWRYSDMELFHSVDNLYRTMKVDDHEFIACKCFADNVPVLKKEWFNETVMLDFEYIKVPAPAAFHDVLVCFYGNDYMKPCQAPSMHGSFAVLDPSKSYKEYIPFLRKANK